MVRAKGGECRSDDLYSWMTPREPLPESLAAAAVVAADMPADERQLVEALLRRDRKAAAEFVSKYADSVYGYVRHRLAPRVDRVDDLVQDVFLAALAGLGGFRGTSTLGVWLIGIARHKVESFYREQLRQPEALTEGDEGDVPADGPLIDDEIDRDRVQARAQRILRQLPESYSAALLWRYWEGRSAREMAEATGRTEKAVERLLARARARFRALWEQE